MDHQPTAAPRTGNPEVDAALAALVDLPRQPLQEHHQSLAAAHEVLVELLDEGRRVSANPVPTGLRPGQGHHG